MTTMKALMSDQPGGPESLVLREVPEPTPGADEVRVVVKACGINYPDALMIEDKYQFRPPRPFAPIRCRPKERAISPPAHSSCSGK